MPSSVWPRPRSPCTFRRSWRCRPIRASLAALDQAIGRVSQHRGRFGALHSRLERALDLGEIASSSALAARGRILDADMAAELGTLTRQQVLAQASQALRSQAAALPRQVLGILLGAGSGTS